ncbi:hypothetical protein F4X86_04535 [Candidatus Saccharibacteria bacterium]|nr:hypothetical protein [Candidatus Saccharibacteria bacterium]
MEVLALKPSELCNRERGSFEETLFADGVYLYDQEKEIAEAEHGVNNYEKWLVGTERTPVVVNEQLRREKRQCRSGLIWKEYFSGAVPADWHDWRAPLHAFEEAGELGVQLSPTLVYAGVLHEHHPVVIETGKNQLLNEEQLAICFVKDLPLWDLNEILDAQRKMGVGEDQIARAKSLAEEKKRQMRDKKNVMASDPQLDQ